jgi:hypothetical protein
LASYSFPSARCNEVTGIGVAGEQLCAPDADVIEHNLVFGGTANTNRASPERASRGVSAPVLGINQHQESISELFQTRLLRVSHCGGVLIAG